MRSAARDVALVIVIVASACGGRSPISLLQCGDPGGRCVTVEHDASKVVYECHLHGRFALALEQSYVGEIPVCLPPALNRHVASAAQTAMIDAMTQHEYDVAVARFGNGGLLEQIAALKAIDASGDACDIWRAALADPLSYCKVLRAERDASCEVPCVPKICKPEDCSNVTRSDGTINPSACRCNTTVRSKTDCELPGATLCIAP